MEPNTKVSAVEKSQELFISRVFDLPVELLFKAHVDSALFENWMSTRLVKFDCKPHGSYRFETEDTNGNVVFSANGVFHELIHNQKITRTFEMERSPFPVQLEFLEFEELSPDKSKLTIHILFKSTAYRDQLMQMPFVQGLNHAHNKLQEIFN